MRVGGRQEGGREGKRTSRVVEGGVRKEDVDVLKTKPDSQFRLNAVLVEKPVRQCNK